MTAIVIYPSFDAVYYSFYIQGIIDTFGKSTIQFSSKPFPLIPSGQLAFIYTNQKKLRVVIDAYDGAGIKDRTGLAWCDIYGKVNLALSAIPKDQAHKCVPIGPNFGVQVWSPIDSWRLALNNYRFSVDYGGGSGAASRVLGSPRLNNAFQHFANYRRQYKSRLPLRCFTPGPSRNDYIFFISTFWKEEEAPGTSEHRALFIESCRSLTGVTFEGGLVPSLSQPLPSRFGNYVAPKLFPLSEYLEKIKSSAFVFSTPAVWGSHTWKLAEFLALGKAIISTALTRDLPVPLIHGRHLHYVDGSLGSIQAAVHLLLNDVDYRKHLERNAYDYYLSFLTPTRVIQRLLALG